MLADVACETPVHFQENPKFRVWLCCGECCFRASGFGMQGSVLLVSKGGGRIPQAQKFRLQYSEPLRLG